MPKKFTPDCTVLSMIQPDPLPGSYRHTGAHISEIVDKAVAETQMVVDNGFDGIIVQNMNDMPVKQIAEPEAIAYMTRIGLAIREQFPSLTMGILLNWDGLASLCVADAVGADFVRVEHLFTGVNVTSAGLLQGQCVEIARLRKRLGTTVPVYADIFEVHGVPVGAKPVADAAWEAVHEGFADGLFLSGTSAAASIDMVTQARTKVANIPIICGGGATGDNVGQLLEHFDGVSVATWIKGGDMTQPIDPARAGIFLEQAGLAKQKKAARLA